MSVATASIAKPTPMMQQYLRVKEDHKDCLILFRMGDFFELFFDDAIDAAPVLEVALTRRGKTEGQDIPMCGVPHHASEFYIRKLIKAGFKVAICDQLETPEEAKKRAGYKAVVKRDVIRVITQGTLTEEGLLEGKTSNYLLSVYKDKEKYTLAYADISTLEFKCFESTKHTVSSDIARIDPAEIIIPDSLIVDSDFQSIYREYKNKIITFVDSFFSLKKNELKLKTNYNVQALEVFGNFSDVQIITCGALVEYICATQKQEKVALLPPKIDSSSDYMIIDQTARSNLELFSSLNENGIPLIKTIDKTLSNPGGRLLRQYLAFPSVNVDLINKRYNLVEFFLKNITLRQKIRQEIKSLPDIERFVGKIAYNRGNPQDLYQIKQALLVANNLSNELSNAQNDQTKSIAENLTKAESVLDILKEALVDRDIYLNQKDFVSAKFHPELEDLYNFRDNSKNLITELREEYRGKTAVPNLKIEFNNVIGYYVEVTKTNLDKINENEEFIHRQTMVNGGRFTTEKLKAVESKIFTAKTQIEVIEAYVFSELSDKITANNKLLNLVAQSLAYLDVITSLAELASSNNYCRPSLDQSEKFEITNGRHPVVEQTMEQGTATQFIANSCNLENRQKLWLITGPNMAGKSTFLRQNALIAIMAQIGSFVPAESANIGVVDRVFSRVGAGDNLAQGRSTFLVEMIEAATILNQATAKSLVILDEIGRGTSTYDGLAIAWSCLEYIHNRLKCRTLFATHYHELTELAEKLSAMKCYTIQVKEWEGKIMFMHKVISGIADRSYGINVAELAGIPKVVIDRAKSVLSKLHDQNYSNEKLDLFSYQAMQSAKQDKAGEELKQFIESIKPDEISPKEALEIIYQLKTLLYK